MPDDRLRHDTNVFLLTETWLATFLPVQLIFAQCKPNGFSLPHLGRSQRAEGSVVAIHYLLCAALHYIIILPLSP